LAKKKNGCDLSYETISIFILTCLLDDLIFYSSKRISGSIQEIRL